MMSKRFLIILFMFSAITGCSRNNKADLLYTSEQIDSLAFETKHTNEKNGGNIIFSDYNHGVNKQESKGLMYNRLTFFAICFESVEQASSEALRLNQYYSRNWLFDRVQGEPILEDYVIKTFKAINPNKKTQRAPKKHTESLEVEHAAPEVHH
jgi:hypothetical protein